MSRDFDLGDIPSITTGALVSPRHIDGVYDILDYMTGEQLFFDSGARVLHRQHMRVVCDFRRQPHLGNFTSVFDLPQIFFIEPFSNDFQFTDAAF